MAEAPKTAAQQSSDLHAFQAALSYFDHRRQWQTLLAARPGMCVADGPDVSQQTLDGDFELDESVVERLLWNSDMRPLMRPSPPAASAGAPERGSSSVVKESLFPPSPTAPVGSLARLGQELRGAVYGPGNVLANSSAALAGALQGVHEKHVARKLQEGLKSIREGRAQRVPLSPHMELYNSAQGRQAPRVRLRIRGVPLQIIRRAIPAIGGPVTQWRVNGPGTAATLKGSTMTAQQIRNAAVMAGEQHLPGLLRWTQGRVGTGVLAFAPSAALDLYNAIDTDLAGRPVNFNGRRFLVDSARSQSGNLVGLGGGMLAVAAVGFITAGAVAGAPLVLIGLVGGVVLQVAWNSWGFADEAADLAQGALR